VSIQADDGVKTKPTCPANSGTTAETNNLFFAKAPARAPKLQYPSIEFTMSSKAGGKATCDTERGA
jgi:DNA mismatch repair ATPase MutL